MPEPLPHLAYIATGYPYVSHTFIQNEVAALRELGVRIDTFAIRRAPESECRSESDRQARASTYALRPPKPQHYFRAHRAAVSQHRATYFRTLVRALRLGGRCAGDLVHQLAYFAQGVVLWDRCRTAGVTHVHAHFANVGSDVASIAAAIGGAELSWSFTMHGPTEFSDVRHYHLAQKTRDARFVICISEFARSQLMALVEPEHWEKLRVVHCGVDVDRFTPGSREHPLHDNTARRGQLHIACVGRLVPEKGQRLLIEAIAALRRAGADVCVSFAGDGPERSTLEQMATRLSISEHVEFLGAVAHAGVETLLERSDVFCLTSFAEGVPIVLMEAMAMELPVLATRVMGIPELIEDGVSGRLISPGSVSELTAVLTELIDEPEQRRTLGQEGRRRVASRFELRANAERLRSVYEEMLEPLTNLGSEAGAACPQLRLT